jgi:hypothetical protein
VKYYRDGGTVSFVIVDANGNMLPAGLSRQLSAKQHRFYVGAELYGRGDAETLKVGGSREKALVSILQSWLDQELSADDQEVLAHCKTPQRGSKRQDYMFVLQAIEETKLRRLDFTQAHSEGE